MIKVCVPLTSTIFNTGEIHSTSNYTVLLPNFLALILPFKVSVAQLLPLLTMQTPVNIRLTSSYKHLRQSICILTNFLLVTLIPISQTFSSPIYADEL